MIAVELNTDNIEQYTEYLSEDIAENIGRTFFRGLVVTKEEVTGI